MKCSIIPLITLLAALSCGCDQEPARAGEATPVAQNSSPSWIKSGPLVAASSEHLGSWFARIELVSGSAKTLSAPIEGRLVTWRVKPGDHVEQGAPLAELVAEELADLASAQRELQRRIKAQETMLEAREAQLATGVIASPQVDELRASLEMDRAHAAALSQQRSVRMSDLERAPGNRIIWSSPTSGEVTTLGCAQGQRIVPQDPCLGLIHVEAPEVVAYLPEQEIGRLSEVSRGQMLTASGARVEVTFSRLDPIIESGHGMIKSYWQFVDSVPTGLMAGMSGRLTLQKEASPRAMSVTWRATTQLEGRDVLFAREGEGWSPRPIDIIKAHQHTIIFTSDALAPGDEVAIEGVYSLKSEHLMQGE